MNPTTRADAQAGSLAGRFEATFGAAPHDVWAAPGRVNLIGEHTDYNEGFVLPFAIDKRARAAVRLRDDSTVRLLSTVGGAPAGRGLTHRQHVGQHVEKGASPA